MHPKLHVPSPVSSPPFREPVTTYASQVGISFIWILTAVYGFQPRRPVVSRPTVLYFSITWEFIKNANSWVHPVHTESEIPGSAAQWGVV